MAEICSKWSGIRSL